MTGAAVSQRVATARDQLLAALDQDPRPQVVVLPAPRVDDPTALLEVTPTEPSFAWFSPGGDAFAGVGAALTLSAEGPRRVEAIRRGLAEWYTGLESPIRPRAFGGFAFQPGAADEPCWKGFGDAAFVVPRWTYECGDGFARLLLVLSPAPAVADVLGELERIETALWSPRSSRRMPRVSDLREPSASHWLNYVDGVRRAIERGRVAKVVAAHRTELEFDSPLDVPHIVRSLREFSPGTTCIAFRRGSATLVAATPEHLVTRSGSVVETEALAGSIRAGDRGAADVLRASEKNRAEHEFVVEEILERLGPLTHRVCAAPMEVKELPHVLHLRTPISGRLQPHVDVLELVEALHPTPAVGGVPRPEALSYIAAHEATPRGWYAGPVGWVDGDGDGEFVVALRSGLLLDRSALLYAGSGIVRGSDAQDEYVETMLKRQAVLEALRARPGGDRRVVPPSHVPVERAP